MPNKLLFTTVLILSSCTIVTAGDIDGQGILHESSQVEESFVLAPGVMDEQDDSIMNSPSVETSTVAPEVQTIPILHATLICDNPPANYQDQLTQSGAKILKVESSISGEENEAVQTIMVSIEVADYDVLTRVGQLNFVMRIDSIKELAGIADKISEGDRWILGLPDSEMVEVNLIPANAGLTDALRGQDGVEIVDKADTVVRIRCSVARLKELAVLEEIAAILAATEREVVNH